MAEAESTNTMFQNSFAKQSDGVYALRTTGAGGGGVSTVSLDPAGNTVKIDQTGTNNATQSLVPTAARISSVVGYGSANAPAAAGVVATSGSLAIGTWDVEVWTLVTGTTVATADSGNMRLVQNATNLGTVITPVNGTSGATNTGYLKQRIQVTTAGAVTVAAIGAATANSVYSASIVATRVM